jgi:tricorn protease-like protein
VGGAADTHLLRFPDVHGDRVVFVHAEDIWTVPATGGTAARLTDDEGEERHPKFSPDGSLIGFTAEIDGNPDVYVMASADGDIRRLTLPDYRIYTPERQWTVENEGVTPDIVVELDPAEMARGWDAQLQRGIEVLLDALASDPKAPAAHPPLPTVR